MNLSTIINSTLSCKLRLPSFTISLLFHNQIFFYGAIKKLKILQYSRWMIPLRIYFSSVPYAWMCSLCIHNFFLLGLKISRSPDKLESSTRLVGEEIG